MSPAWSLPVAAKGGALVLALVLVAGEVAFVRERPISETTYARTKDDPAGDFNLADPALGVTIRASSVDWRNRHHPAYVLSGRVGTDTERWAPGEADKEPWIEVEFERTRHVERVDLTFARPAPSFRRNRPYSAVCFSGAAVRLGSSVGVEADGRASTPLECEGAARVRVTLPRDDGDARDAPSLYGLQVWGHS